MTFPQNRTRVMESGGVSVVQGRQNAPSVMMSSKYREAHFVVVLYTLAFLILVLGSTVRSSAFDFNIKVSGSAPHLHLKATTIPQSRIVWLTGPKPDSATNVVSIEPAAVFVHDLPIQPTQDAQFFRAIRIDTNSVRAPAAITGFHSLAILTNGSIACWGDNQYGEFGNNLKTTISTPNLSEACWNYVTNINDSPGPLLQSADTDWVSVAAGYDYCLALKSSGAIWAWGNDVMASLGYPTADGVYVGIYAFPVPVGTNATWQSIFAYGYSSFGIRTDGTLWAWGDNTASVLGVGDQYANTNRVVIPTQVGTSSNWVKVVCFPRAVTVGIQTDGSLWAWGQTTLPSALRAGYAQTNLALTPTTSPALVNIPGPWVDVGFSPLSYARGIFLRADGTLWAVTTNSSLYSTWQIYKGYLQNQYTNPASIYHILIQAGASASDALTYVKGTFFTINPTLRDFDFSDANYTRFLKQTSDAEFFQSYSSQSNWIMMASAIALKEDGTVWTIGEGPTRSGSSPKDGDWQRVNSDTDWSYVFSGFGAIKSDGRLWSWGPGSFPDTTQATNIDMVRMPGTNRWIKGLLCASHAAALDTQSNLWVWGANIYGELGVGDNEPRLTPTKLSGTWSDFMVSGSGDDGMTIAIRQDGSLWVWGDYNFTQTNITSPMPLYPGRTWRSVYARDTGLVGPKAYLLEKNGTLWGYGNNYGNILGLSNTNLSITTPEPLPGSNWLAVSTGNDFGIALRENGSLWGWGANSVSMGLGYVTNLTYTNPIVVSAGPWKAIAADGKNGFAIRSDGSLWSWGLQDGYCELGQPAFQALSNTNCWRCNFPPCDETDNPKVYPAGTPVVQPLQVGTSIHWKSVTTDASGRFTLGLQEDGSLWAWGLSPFASVTNDAIYLTPSTHPYPGVPYPTYRTVVPAPVRVGTNSWRFIDSSGTAVTTSGDLYFLSNRGANGQTFNIPAWKPSPVRSNIVCRFPF